MWAKPGNQKLRSADGQLQGGAAKVGGGGGTIGHRSIKMANTLLYFNSPPFQLSFLFPSHHLPPSTLLTMGSKSQMLRDAAVRIAASTSEIQRRALLAIARNTSLEASVRHRAQLGLGNMESKGRAGRVKNRCMETGRGRGVMSEFGLCRVSSEPKPSDSEASDGSNSC